MTSIDVDVYRRELSDDIRVQLRNLWRTGSSDAPWVPLTKGTLQIEQQKELLMFDCARTRLKTMALIEDRKVKDNIEVRLTGKGGAVCRVLFGDPNPTKIELGCIARSLPENARLALRWWPMDRPWQGALLTGTGYAVMGAGGRKITLGARQTSALVKAGLAEERLLWLSMTELGEEVAGWLGRK